MLRRYLQFQLPDPQVVVIDVMYGANIMNVCFDITVSARKG